MAQAPARPAWSEQFVAEAIREVIASGPIGEITPEWAWGGSSGRGMRVAIIDTGVDYDHPALGDSVRGGVVVEYDEQAKLKIRIDPEEKPRDMAGHGTACAGIIHSLAPEAEIYSVRVLGQDMHGRAIQFAGGLDWAIENGMHVANLSLSTARQEHYSMFHHLADDAYFRNTMLVCSMSNYPEASYPSEYSSVVSVAAHEGQDPFTYYYNPKPPAEFGAPGINVRVAWKDRQFARITGNSFATPHIAGIVTLIRAKHPELAPFQIKTVLCACAANVRRQ